jgi:hypothetical protein
MPFADVSIYCHPRDFRGLRNYSRCFKCLHQSPEDSLTTEDTKIAKFEGGVDVPSLRVLRAFVVNLSLRPGRAALGS